jgi:hypothetical protein
VAVPAPFPSVEWFERLAELMRTDRPRFEALGTTDCAMLAKVDRSEGRSELYEVVFEGFGVKSVRRLEQLEKAVSSHFVIEGELGVWREMIENIRANGRADRAHTLNTLTLPDDPMRVHGPDQLEVDAFYRYNETLQRFFDGAARLPTAFARH